MQVQTVSPVLHKITPKNRKPFIFSENSQTALPIELTLNECWLFLAPIYERSLCFELIERYEPYLKDLAQAAYSDPNSIAWEEIQNILYLWNMQDLLRQNMLGDYRHIVRSALRQSILEVEKKFEPVYPFELKNFTPKKAVEILADYAKSHRINKHPLVERMASKGLTQKDCQTFLDNYYVNNRMFHVFLAALSLLTPLERRTELASNFFDELGAGDAEVAHPLLFLKNFQKIGLPKIIKPQASTLYLFNAKTYATFLKGNYYYGMGALGFIELTMPKQMQSILQGLQKSGFSEEELIFWSSHIIIDTGHGQTWFEEMQKLIVTPLQANQCLQGGMKLLDARAKLYDGILNACEGEIK